MSADKVRITTAEAIVRFLIAQRIRTQGTELPLFPGVFAIFGHGNVTTLGHSLEMHRHEIPVWRGHNEQGMGLAAAAFAKARRRQQIMVCTTSIGPGATNLVTAAGVAMANRLPVLFISGDTFNSRIPDPVLQQVEHFGTPSTTVNDAFRAVTRYWDRLTHPAQVASALPHAVSSMLDPATCGPVFLGIPQDVGAQAFDYPAALFDPYVHEIPRPRPDTGELTRAAGVLRAAQRPVIIAGGGVHYSLAEAELAGFAQAHGIPVVETVAGKSSLLAEHPCYAGPMGVTGADAANKVIARADVVLAVGTRLQDFATGSWTLLPSQARIVAVNTARFDAGKHRAVSLVADAAVALAELDERLGSWRAEPAWTEQATVARAELTGFVAGRTRPDGTWPPSYAQLVGLVHRSATDEDYVLTAAGGLPGELNINWASKAIASFDCEYGFSCMGYEVSGGWGAAMARPHGQVYVMVGDGSYLMLNSDVFASVQSGHKFILIVCDNEGFAVIDRLQLAQGGRPYNNLLRDSTGPGSAARVDFRAHAESLGALALAAGNEDEFVAALDVARRAERTTVIVTKVRPGDWTEGGAFWQVGVPEVSELPTVAAARAAMDAGLQAQRIGV